jgi:hypothetical protein
LPQLIELPMSFYAGAVRQLEWQLMLDDLLAKTGSTSTADKAGVPAFARSLIIVGCYARSDISSVWVKHCFLFLLGGSPEAGEELGNFTGYLSLFAADSRVG